MKKLLTKDLKQYRELQWEKQNGICPLCNSYIEKDEAVLDHCHTTGNCRQVLHNGCNRYEGKVKSGFSRFVGTKKGELIDFLKKLVVYLEGSYSSNPIHPTELTPHEKELKSITKKLKTLKRPSVKEAYQDRAKELRKLIKEERKENSWRPE